MIDLERIKMMIIYYDLFVNQKKSYREIANIYNVNHMKVKRTLEDIKYFDPDKYIKYRRVIDEKKVKK